MKITEIKTNLVNVGSRNFSIVQIDTDEGISGVGEGTATYGAGTMAIAGAVNEIAPFIIGQDPFKIEHLFEMLCSRSFWGKCGGPFIGSAISGIEQALWDIKGKALNIPVYEMLGGRVREKIRVYANIWATTPIPGHRTAWQNKDEYANFALKAVSDGFTAIKIYPFGVGEVVKDDIKIVNRVKAVRDAVGDEVDIMVDGGWRYSADISTAIRIGKKLEEFNLLFYEEPISPDQIDSMAKVAQGVHIPLAAGERIYTAAKFREYLDRGAIDIAQPDIGLAGGILALKKIAAISDTYSVPIAPHLCAGPVATAATIQLVACVSNFLIQEIFPYEYAWHEIVEESLESKIENGYIAIPRKAGLGVELNAEFLRKNPYKPLFVSH